MNQTTKVFLACALGAFIGAFVALELNQYLWWIGMLVGGLVGYLAYDFKNVISAVPKAWELTTKNLRWPSVYLCKELGKWFVGVGIYLATSWLFVKYIFLTIVDYNNSSSLQILFYIYLLVGFLALIIGIIVLSVGLIEVLFVGNKHDQTGSVSVILGSVMNPVVFPITVAGAMIFVVCLGLYKLTMLAPTILRFTANFIANLFNLIHSDVRLLCGIDAAIGVAIGYFSGSAIVGGLAGGLFGVLNFEILSIRVLKLVPVENSVFDSFSK